MQNMQDRLIKQLDDAWAMEKAHARMLDESIGVVNEPHVRALLKKEQGLAHDQEEALESCIRRYGNEPSNGQSLLGRIAGMFGEAIRDNGDTYDAATQALEKEFGAESFKLGVYRALGTYASLVGEKETAQLATHHMEGARDAVGAVWSLMPRIASEAVEGTWAENVVEEMTPSMGTLAGGTTVPNSMPNDLGPLASARDIPSDTNSLKAARPRDAAEYCGDVMTQTVAVVPPDATLQEAARMMREMNIGPLPVCEGGKVVGMITDRDLTVRASALGRDPRSTRVRDVMTQDVVCAAEGDRVTQAAQLMEDRQVRRIPVVDEQGQIKGIVSLADISVRKGGDRLSAEVLRRVSERGDGEAMLVH